MSDEWLTDASVEIKGKDRNGTPITLTGDIENTRVEADFSTEEWSSRKISAAGQYYLKFKAKENGEQFRIQLATREVERTAEIEIDGCTPANIELARKAVGAPVDAGVRPMGAGYWPEAVRINLASDKVKLIFVWTETVVLR